MFSATFSKSLPFSNETRVSAETTHNRFQEYLRNVLDKFRKFRKSQPNWQKPMYYSTGIFYWFSATFLKSLPIWNETWASDETTHNRFRDYLRNVLDKFRKFWKSHPNWQKPMYYSTGILLIFSNIFKTTVILKRNMGFWWNYSQQVQEYLRNVFNKFRKFRKSHPYWQKPMYYSTGI